MPASSTLLSPILVLWIGSLILYVIDRFSKLQDRGIAEIVVLAVSTGFLATAHSHIDRPLLLGNLTTKDVPPFLAIGNTSWFLAMLLLGCVLASLLLLLGQSPAGRAGRLATLGAALLFLFAGDWGTLALAWVLVDIGLLFTLGQGQKRTDSLIWSGILSLTGAVVLGTALLLWHQADGHIWVDSNVSSPIDGIAASNMPPHVAGLLILAAILRLIPFPLPMWQLANRTDNSESIPAAQMLAFIVPLLLATLLWTRLAQWSVLAQSGRWLSVLNIWAGIGLVITAFRAWSIDDPGSVISTALIYGGLYLLLAASLGLRAEWQMLVGTNLVLSLSVISISWQQCQYLDLHFPRSYWRAIPSGVGVLSLAGIPLLVGFPARVSLYWAIFQTHSWFSMLALMVAEALIIGALLRTILDVESTPQHTLPDSDQDMPEKEEPLLADKVGLLTFLPTTWERWIDRLGSFLRVIVPNTLVSVFGQIDWPRELVYCAASGIALGMLILGAKPGLLDIDGASQGLAYWFSMPRLPVWAALLLPIVGGMVLYRQQDITLNLVQDWWPLLQRLSIADWIYRIVEQGLGWVRALIWGTTQVIEGAGYMAWVLVVCLVLLLLVISH